MSERRIKVGLIGYGLAGAYFHAPLIESVDRLALTAIVTSRRERQSGLGADVKLVARPEAVIEDPSIELVIIASPNCTHYPLAAAALRAGKHVVVDKPFMVSLDEADSVIALAARGERMLSVFHNRRWDGDFRTVKHLLVSGCLGAATHFEARWDRFRPAIKPGWREVPAPGAGLLADLGPHLVDQVLQLFGTPEMISADIAHQRAAAEVEDYFEIRLHYGTMRAIIGGSTLIADPRPRFSVHGQSASFVKHGLDPQEVQLRAGLHPRTAAFGEDDPRRHGRLTTPDGSAIPIATLRGCYARYYEGVADAILDGAPAPVDAADARLGLKILELARQSARDGTQRDVA